MQTMPEQPGEVLDDAPLFIRWNPDRSPYAIELKLDLVSKMAEEISRARDAGNEIGGLLYGTTPTPGLPILRIEDFLVVPGRPEDGPTYMLDPKQQDDFAAARWGNKKGARAELGFFRSNSRGGALRPSLTDRSLISAQFTHGIAPVLLVEANEPRTGVFFLARNGQLPEEASVQEFHFNDRDFRSLPEIEPTIPPAPSEKAFSAQSSKRSAWVGVLGALLLLLALALWSLEGSGSSNRLDLTVTARPQALDISWNHSSSQIERAVDGTLTLKDGKNSQEYKLGRDELRLGVVHYRTNTPEVKVTLALNMTGATSLTQSVDWRTP